MKSINLLKNEIGDEGFEAIKIAFEGNEHLKSVCGIKEDETDKYFLYHSLKPVDGKLLALDLKFNASLKKIDLEGNNIGDEGAMAIKQVFKGTLNY